MNTNIELAVDASTSIVVDFILLPHFSLLCFTAAADALTTANLVNKRAQFRFRTIALQGKSVMSDLGICLLATYTLDDPELAPERKLSANSVVLVCGGYRCNLEANSKLSDWLRQRDTSAYQLGGLWNGIIAVAVAGLMTGYACALHPDDQAQALREHPELLVRPDTLVLDRRRLSAAGPSSAFELMLMIIGRHDTAETVHSIRQILKADTSLSHASRPIICSQRQEKLPENLQNALRLMRNHLDEPVSKQTVARHINLSTRAMERLFQHHLNTSPARYYLQLRLQRAHELLSQGDISISEVSDICGFVSQAHFSRCFHRNFGVPPSAVRRSISSLLDP